MNSRTSPFTPAFWLFALGFFTCTWDTLLTLELNGFTFKLYQGFFLLSFLCVLLEHRKKGMASFLAPLAAPFAACMLLFFIFQLGLTPWSVFPLKSFLYSCWLLFDIGAIWLTAQHLGRTVPTEYFLRLAWATMVSLSLVVIVDQAAYQFGYTAGFVGLNQDASLRWGMSRPHAFSFEPSYLATFLSLGLLTTALPMFHLSRRKLVFWLCLFAILFSTFATTSRTGWVNLAMGIAAILTLPLLAGRKLQWRLFAAILGLLGTVSLLFVVTTPAKQREVMVQSLLRTVVTGNDGSGNARLRAHVIAYEMAKSTHWVGAGFGASYRYFILHGGQDHYHTDPLAPRHTGNEVIMSTWGQILAEGGILSILLFGLAGAFLARSLFRRLKKEDNPFALSALAGTLVFFGFASFWLGNLCRGDVWVWYALWSVVAEAGKPQSA